MVQGAGEILYEIWRDAGGFSSPAVDESAAIDFEEVGRHHTLETCHGLSSSKNESAIMMPIIILMGFDVNRHQCIITTELLA